MVHYVHNSPPFMDDETMVHYMSTIVHLYGWWNYAVRVTMVQDFRTHTTTGVFEAFNIISLPYLNIIIEFQHNVIAGFGQNKLVVQRINNAEKYKERLSKFAVEF